MMNTIKQLRTLTLIWFCELLRINIGTTAGFMFLIFIHVYAYSTVTSVFTVLLILMYFSFVICYPIDILKTHVEFQTTI